MRRLFSILWKYQMTATTQTNNHFNLHATGVGYINRVRWVQPDRKAGRRADPFLACSISAMRGDSDKPDYTYFDLRVSGAEAQAIVQKIGEDLELNRKVVVSFRIGDIYAHHYERDVRVDGKKTGEIEVASLIKGRLLLINSVNVDGERVYTRESKQGDDAVETPEDMDEGPVEQQPQPEALAEPEAPQAPMVPTSVPRANGFPVGRPARVSAPLNGSRNSLPGRLIGTHVKPGIRVNDAVPA